MGSNELRQLFHIKESLVMDLKMYIINKNDKNIYIDRLDNRKFKVNKLKIWIKTFIHFLVYVRDFSGFIYCYLCSFSF